MSSFSRFLKQRTTHVLFGTLLIAGLVASGGGTAKAQQNSVSEPATMARLEATLGHSAGYGIKDAALSPDGRYLVTVGGKSVLLWEVRTGRRLRQFSGHTSKVFAVAFSPNGKHVATGSDDGTARLWDISTGEEVRRFQGHEHWVRAIAFSPDGRFLLTGSQDKTARLWDVSNGQETRRFSPFARPVENLGFTPDGHHLFIAGREKVYVWDTRNWESPRVLPTGHVTSLGGLKQSSQHLGQNFTRFLPIEGLSGLVVELSSYLIQLGLGHLR